jgi:O-antigen/teichoic acid export membrane protein
VIAVRPFLHTALRSPALRVTFLYGIAGLGFSGANLLLARALSYTEFGLFALMVTFFNVGIPIAPAGADGVINRRRIDPGPRVLTRALVTSAATSLVLIVVGRFIYEVDPRYLLLLPIAIVAGGVNWVAAAYYQSAQRFTTSLALAQGSNIVMLAASVLAVVAGMRSAWPPLLLLTLWFLAAAIFGTNRVLREHPLHDMGGEPFRWSEALSIVGVSGVGIVLGQLERLVIPQVLTLEALATYSVLAAIVGSVFRMMWLGVGYTLLPRLRRAESVGERRRLLAGEGAVVTAVIVTASLGIWYLTPLVVKWALAGKYILPPALIVAALANGILKVIAAFSKAAATALGSTRDLAYLNFLSWISLGLGVAGAMIGGRWGLTGVVYGVALGWLAVAISAALLALPHLREPSHGPDTATTKAVSDPMGRADAVAHPLRPTGIDQHGEQHAGGR